MDEALTELEDYSTSALLAEINRHETSKVRKVSKRTSLFADDRMGRFFRCETCKVVLDMPKHDGWFIDNHWRQGTLWHAPCYGRIEKAGYHTKYKGALRSEKTGELHILNW
jgi:hypothetical protein